VDETSSDVPCQHVYGFLQDTVGELKKKYHAKAPKYYPARQRLTLPAKEGQKSGDVLQDRDQLSKYGLSNGSVVLFKDLGTQVSYRPERAQSPAQKTLPAASDPGQQGCKLLYTQQVAQHNLKPCVLALILL
jgi:hypothetical protein